MIPRSNGENDDLQIEFEEERQTSRTYRLDLTRKRIIGYTDGREAIEQAIYKELATERYEYRIYTWNYGSEIAKLFGKPIPYVYSELKRLITEALAHDDRIERVDAFLFSYVKNKVAVSFIAYTVEGEIGIETEVVI